MTFVCYHYSRASLHVRGERVHLVTSHLLFVWPLRSFLPRLFTSHDIRSTPAQCKYLDFLHHVAAMLSFPDRQRKFEQLRARWRPLRLARSQVWWEDGRSDSLTKSLIRSSNMTPAASFAESSVMVLLSSHFNNERLYLDASSRATRHWP
jgi:hypothetical protein